MIPTHAESGPVDVVILWVDSADPDWQAEMARHCPRRKRLRPAPYRHRNNGELRYALRSIARNLPWVNRIHLVTNGQVPAWLDLRHPRLHLIEHRDFFARPADLPTFSSLAIEANFARLGQAGVARRFLAFNDDMFVGRPMKLSDFQAEDGRTIWRGEGWRLPRPRLKAALHDHNMMTSGVVLDLMQGHRRRAVPAHLPILLDLDELARVAHRFRLFLRRTSRHRVRHRTDVLPNVIYLHAISEGVHGGASTGIEQPLSNAFGRFVSMVDEDRFSTELATLVATPPPLFCINDDIADERRAAIRGAELRAALEAIFPGREPWEIA